MGGPGLIMLIKNPIISICNSTIRLWVQPALTVMQGRVLQIGMTKWSAMDSA
jgi:hypothetical protein